MSTLTMLTILLLKHGLLAHVVDFGYSYGRSVFRRFWYLGLLTHTVLELAITRLILIEYVWDQVWMILMIEAFVLILSGVTEKLAPMRRVLQTHLSCELIVATMYPTVIYVVLK